MHIVSTLLEIIFVLNLIFAIFTVFKEKRDISATWAWLLVLLLLPVVGFIMYLFVGKKLSKDDIYDIKTQQQMGLDQLVNLQKEQWHKKDLLPADEITDTSREMVHLFLETDKSILTKYNEVKLLTDGEQKVCRIICGY